MSPGATIVPRDSPVHREFERLYRLAQVLRPTVADRWNGELYATEGDNWGGYDPATGRISLARELVLRHLGGPGHAASPAEQAQALATVLHEVTHAQMQTDAPDQPNAVRSEHSLGVMEGFAEVRALRDFRAFARLTGYAGLDLPKPHYPAAHAAVEELLNQAAGPRKIFNELIAEGTRGPGVMHFDQLADGVLLNRLHDVVPDRAEDRLAVRAALIETMLHPGWLVLKDLKDVGTGHEVAHNIRRKLDAKVDQLRQHYRAQPGQVFPAEGPNAAAARVAEGNELAAMPPPAAADRVDGPVRGGWTPAPAPRSDTVAAEAGGSGSPAVQSLRSDSPAGQAQHDPATATPAHSDPATVAHAPGDPTAAPRALGDPTAAPRPLGDPTAVPRALGDPTAAMPAHSDPATVAHAPGDPTTPPHALGDPTTAAPVLGDPAAAAAAQGPMRFLGGQAPAAGAVGRRPRLGKGARGGSVRSGGQGRGGAAIGD